MFRYLVVGGHFGEKPRASGYIRKLYSALHALNPAGLLINSGTYHYLKSIESSRLAYYDVIIWMPDVSNDKEKVVQRIKKENPHTILVTSKNNIDKKYDFKELIARALQVKANLSVEFTKNDKGIISGLLYDPLGNSFCETADITELAVALIQRIQKLLKYTRIGSKAYEMGIMSSPADIEPEFYDIVKNYADVFHKCIHAADQSRLLGNASFRCERGFPSFKYEDQVYVSHRNIDKRFIEPEGFVPVRLVFNDVSKKVIVAYQGENKPSVDAPIHLLLYHYYSEIKYMIHSHTYISGAYFTDEKIPCGAIEEFYEITRIFPRRDIPFLRINLRGHGSLVMAKDISRLKSIEYYPRETPEKRYLTCL